ncbi:hypothetical protein BDV93DRAFT_198726 [Ceratobasidium sp. AG-I]|nr:hypothetical protein BDV93DRAFT_198726 [Ceratobasidium sp. AG-I]
MNLGSPPTANSGSSLTGFAGSLPFTIPNRLLNAFSSLPAHQPSPSNMSELPTLNSQTTFHTSSPVPTLLDSTSVDLSSTGLPGISVPAVSAADEFKANSSLVVSTFIPRVQELARAILHDLARSYELDTPPTQIASNVVQLKSSLMELHSILRQSGVGSLPLTLPADKLNVATIRSPTVEEATTNVGAAYNRANQCRENSGAVHSILEQELPARRAL